MALWVIAVSLAVMAAIQVGKLALSWYSHRTRYGSRTRIKKTLNWMLNGSYE